MRAILFRNSSRRKQSGQEEKAKPTSAHRAFSISRTINTSLGIPLPRVFQSLWLPKSLLPSFAISLSLLRETLRIDKFSLSLSFWSRFSSVPIGLSMAPLVPKGMLRTSIILPDPAGFMDTSQEQMNASHFDGFMNTLGERRGERIRCFRHPPIYRADRLILFLLRSSWRVSLLILLAPRRSRPNGARRLGKLASFEFALVD